MAFGFNINNLFADSPVQTVANPFGGNTGGSSESDTSGGAASGGNQEARGKEESINQASVNAEASLAVGVGAISTIHSDVSQSPEQLAKNEADYTMAAERGIREGLTPEQVAQMSLSSTQISAARQREIYDEVAQNRGTSAEQIQQQQQQQAEQTQQALWGGAGAAIGGAGVTGALDNIFSQNQPSQSQERPAQVAQGQGNSTFAGLLAGLGPLNLGESAREMGPTTAFLADHANIQHGLANGPEQRQRGAAIGMA